MQHISSLLSHGAIGLGADVSTKNELITYLVGILVRACGLGHEDEITAAVLKRENTLATGIGHGIAIPHAKTDAVPSMALACATAAQGVDFGAPDGQPVRLAFLMLSHSSETGQHVRTLGLLSRILLRGEVADRLMKAESRRDVLRTLRKAEEEALISG